MPTDANGFQRIPTDANVDQPLGRVFIVEEMGGLKKLRVGGLWFKKKRYYPMPMRRRGRIGKGIRMGLEMD